MDRWCLLGSERSHRASVIHIHFERSYVIELDHTVDFEQPRALYTTVMNDVDRDHLVNNIVGHVSGVKSPEIKLRIRKLCFSSTCDFCLSDCL
jgi:catalase